MSDSRQVLMKTPQRNETDILSTMSGSFRTLIRSLVRGNTRNALSLAEMARERVSSDGEKIAFQNLVEEMAQGQAIRNALINLPSAVPGIGTVIALGMIGIEDFFILDQGVKLVLAMRVLHGGRLEGGQDLENFVIEVLGEAYGITESGRESGSDTVIRKIMTTMLPQRFVNIGVNKGVRKFLKRILPFRRKSRLLPAGFGIVMSAVNAYEIIVKVGRITMARLDRERQPA